MTIAKKLTITRWVSITSYVALIILLALKSFYFAPEEAALATRFAVFMFSTVPLLIFIPGMIQDTHRSYTWICFVVLGYFIYAVTALAVPAEAALIDWFYCFLTVTLFTFAMMFVRYKKYHEAGYE
ncbi:hypothetical protein SIN8267_02719 [Sinobacterium norvegicum]|uniref:DUF2069 domain-containing protein n=1 Tax=Sinobacterium norvegicum TaxID=1641715 RepID=A0ABM9AH89_9GAMM|nr:DUF2069 domain-containing protein [Sinobacterium norvegicum]CAH0992586.1 hypothetical protein SIN8267_02719 [Sinobacterium norvegicum]